MIGVTREIARLLKFQDHQLVYMGENVRLYMFDLQTRHIIEISDQLEGNILPDSMGWLDNGRKIGVVLFDDDPAYATGGLLYTLDIRTRTLIPLEIGDFKKREVIWLDDWIIFTDEEALNIYRTDYEGHLKQLTENTSDLYLNLSLSQNDQTVVMSILDTTTMQAQLALLDVKTSEITMLDVTSSNEMQPSWSPDGTRLAVDRIVNDQHGIYVYNLENGELERLTYPPDEADSPFWSPDGEKIAFTLMWTMSQNLNIGVINSNGSNLEKFPLVNTYRELLSWSPDSRWIAFSSSNMTTEYVFLQPAFNLQASPLPIAPVNIIHSFLWR
jgi:Tol biopolymer transport system component